MLVVVEYKLFKTKYIGYFLWQQIAGEQLAEIFKESLESRMLSNIIETLARECSGDESGGPILPYLQGLTMVRRFSTLALFLSHSDKISEFYLQQTDYRLKLFVVDLSWTS